MSDFDTFWQRYPRRVGKLAAVRAYAKARTLASADEILAGVEQYRRHLPDDPQFIAHAASWLNAGRWMDEYDVPVIKAVDADWYDECRRMHGGECEGDRMRHHIRKGIEAEKAS